MIAARPITPDSGRPPAIDFATIIRSGLDVEVLHREHPPRAAEAGLHLVGDEDDPVLVADSPQTLDELGGRREEAALALLRLEDDRRDVVRRDVRREQPLERGERGLGIGPAVRVRVRRAVDLGRERPEALLVRVRLRRHRQRQQRAAVERAVERDDALPLRVEPRELDGVLDRLGAGVEERAARLAADRGERAEPLGELDVALVRDDGEVGVEEAIDLLGDRLHDARMVVPTFATPTPPTKSTNVLPSTSVIVAPRARSATIGSWTISGRATACRSRSRISRLRGPGISVRISITRVAATRGEPTMKHPVAR